MAQALLPKIGNDIHLFRYQRQQRVARAGDTARLELQVGDGAILIRVDPAVREGQLRLRQLVAGLTQQQIALTAHATAGLDLGQFGLTGAQVGLRAAQGAVSLIFLL